MSDIPEIPQIGSSIRKSQTHSFALPTISRTKTKNPKYHTSRVAQHRSVFIDKIKDLTTDVKYENMETSNITDEQKKLKNMLRQFNQETYHILGRYIDNPKTQSMKKGRSTSTALTSQIKQKQISNNQQILEICKRELNVLEKRSENLRFLSLEDMERKIFEIKAKIDETRAVTKQIIKKNTLRGLGLKKDDQKIYHEVSDLEQEKYILELKKERLTQDTTYVDAEQKSLEQKIVDADKKIAELSQPFNQITQEQNHLYEQVQNKTRFEEKKKVLQQNMKQMEGQTLASVAKNHRLQGHYLKQLKMLEQYKMKIESLDKTTKQIDLKLQHSKNDLLINQHKLSLVKKGMLNDKSLDKKIEEQKEKGGCNTN